MYSNKKKNLTNANKLSLHELVQDITIDDDDWRCIVTMLVESTKKQQNYTTILHDACEKGYRKAIYSINRDKVFDDFRISSKHTDEKESKWGGKGNASALAEKVREHIGDILLKEGGEANGPLPRYFEAALIKWMIYEGRMKQRARIAFELEAEAEREREFLAMRDEAGVGGKSTSEPRGNSRLRRREEEWKDEIYIDDAPEDGPNLYILLTGFRDPELPMDLITIGVPLRCILKLESLHGDNHFEKSEISFECEDVNSTCDSKEFNSHSAISKSDSVDTLDFWNNLDESNLLDLAIYSYCPPSPESGIDKLYDNISFVLYDFYNTVQDHMIYLQSMKLCEVYEPKYETVRMSSYEDFMKLKPEEYILIPDIIEALLHQIEKNFGEDDEVEAMNISDAENDKDDHPRGSSSLTSEQQGPRGAGVCDASPSEPSLATSLSKVSSAASACLTEKLGPLNLKCELAPQTNVEPSCQPLQKPVLILHGDALRLNAWRAKEEASRDSRDVRSKKAQPKSKFNELKSFEVKPIADPRINDAWHLNNGNEVRNCLRHLNNIYKFCERKGLNKMKTNHLLNILAFKQLMECHLSNYNYTDTSKVKSINAKFQKKKGNNYSTSSSNRQFNVDKEQNTRFNENCCNVAATRRAESIGKRESHHSLWRSKSADSFINASNVRPRLFSLLPPTYNLNSNSVGDLSSNQLLQSFENCADFFSLISVQQSRGLAAVGKQCPVLLEEFGEVEILSPNAFQQIVGNCFQEYECGEFIAKHFLPTDSVLLIFCDNVRQPNEVQEQHVTCSIRTAVCLRDFCDYIVNEESKWLENQRKLRCTNGIVERGRRITFDRGDRRLEEAIFRDEDFILSTSLKASDLRSLNDRQNENDDVAEQSQKALRKDVKRKHATTQTTSAHAKRCQKTPARSSATISTGETAKEKQSASAAFFPSGTRAPRAHEPPASPLTSAATAVGFIGYDLGESRRVQVSNLSWTFEASDGMRVRLARETWLLGSNKKRRMTSVRITIPGEENEGLRYQEGGVDDRCTGLFHLTMANGLIVAFSPLEAPIPDKRRPNELLYEIQISWPSGLIIRPVEYQDADFPFYVLQYYSIKGPEHTTIKDETRRKYLHNGDVVKFFNDASVIVLRPNGTIISIENFGDGDDKSLLSKSEGTRNSLLEAAVLQRETSSSCQSSCGCAPFNPSAILYKILEPDGRHYEVLDGHVVQELNRLETSNEEVEGVKETLVRRADGTDMLIRSNGEVLVSFPDGTRTLYGCLEEGELLHCEWTAEELVRYFGEEEPQGFVSVVTYSRAEHPNYATVSRESPTVGVCGLAMGKYGPHLRLKPQGFGELSTNNKVRVEFCQAGVLLTRQPCPECHRSTSSATFHHIDRPATPREPTSLLTFEDGTSRLVARRDDDDDAGFSRFEVANPVTCDCKYSDDARKLRCRIFALNRNGRAYEYHRRADYQRYLMKMAEDEGSSLVCSDDYSLTLERPRTILGGSRHCQLDYQIPEAGASATYLLGSQSMWEEAALESRGEGPVPLLIARIFMNIVSPDEKSLKNMQSALVQYWREIASGTLMKEYTDGDTMTCKCETDIVSQIRSIALGRTETIDWEIYENGREHLKEIKIKQDEERKRDMIDPSYLNELHEDSN